MSSLARTVSGRVNSLLHLFVGKHSKSSPARRSHGKAAAASAPPPAAARSGAAAGQPAARKAVKPARATSKTKRPAAMTHTADAGGAPAAVAVEGKEEAGASTPPEAAHAAPAAKGTKGTKGTKGKEGKEASPKMKVEPGRYCSARHRLPFSASTQQTRVQNQCR